MPITSEEKCKTQFKKKRNPPVLRTIALIGAGLAVVMVLTLMPWNIFPVQVTEDVTVIAITEHGCVGESQYGVSVVVPECTASIGETVSATFNVPARDQNGYYDPIEQKLSLVEP